MSQQHAEQTEAQYSLPLFSHLLELRNRLLHIVAIVICVFLGLVYFANDIYSYLAIPLTSQLPEGASMIATGVATPFLRQLN